MLVKAFSSTVSGIDARTITIEVNVSSGLSFFLVGLPDNAVKESQQRIIAAFENNGLKMPGRKIVVNMSPADLRKEGSHYDLPIAIGILAASGQIPHDRVGRYVILGELALDGKVLPVKGALPIAIQAMKEGFEGVILPSENAAEAAVVKDINVYGVETLQQVVELINGSSDIQPLRIDTRELYYSNLGHFDVDFADVKGQESVKRALEIAAAGGHNVLMIGSPGSGKSMLAKRMPTIMPAMSLSEALEVTKIHSVAGKLTMQSGRNSGLMTNRPFRSPHHIVSDVALVGGGHTPQPGEISLAHNGVLFLDEMPEFSRNVLEVLRQPLEERRISISRARYSVDYPASFMLIGAMNPCPCGFLTHPDKECVCAPSQVNRYMSKISGPLLDRIDMHIEVVPVDIDNMVAKHNQAETSEQIRLRVSKARDIQEKRFQDCTGIHCNAMMLPNMMEKYCGLQDSSRELIKMAMVTLGLSARAYDRILKVARTIADLDDSQQIEDHHIAEAINFRRLDRQSFSSI